MKYALLALLLALQVTEPPREAYPGQSEHAKPPDGWFCEVQNYDLSVPRDHVCSCERMCDETTGAVREDRNCSVYCWPAACKCPVGHSDACHGG